MHSKHDSLSEFVDLCATIYGFVGLLDLNEIFHNCDYYIDKNNMKPFTFYFIFKFGQENN